MNRMDPGWKVLLIGGCAGIGKTTLAHALAQRFSTSIVQSADIRLALQQATTPQQLPDLHRVATDRPKLLAPEQLCDALIAVSQAMTPALKIICAHHLATDANPAILEGDNILPGLTARPKFSELKQFQNVRPKDEMRSLFLYESDEAELLAMMRRNTLFLKLPVSEQQWMARANWLFGQWLKREAESYGLPTLPARPWTTLLERAIQTY